MGKTIIGTFESGEQAELAVEHLVQELGIDRSDVFVAAAESENTAGEEFDIIEAERGGPDPEKSNATALNGLIEVSADIQDAGAAGRVEETMRSLGAQSIQSH